MSMILPRAAGSRANHSPRYRTTISGLACHVRCSTNRELGWPERYVGIRAPRTASCVADHGAKKHDMPTASSWGQCFMGYSNRASTFCDSPESPRAMRLSSRSTDDQHRVWNGSIWLPFTSSSALGTRRGDASRLKPSTAALTLWARNETCPAVLPHSVLYTVPRGKASRVA